MRVAFDSVQVLVAAIASGARVRASRQVARGSRLGERTEMTAERRGTRLMWALARRIEYLYYEIDDHDRVLKALLDQITPQLLAARRAGRRYIPVVGGISVLEVGEPDGRTEVFPTMCQSRPEVCGDPRASHVAERQ